MFPTDEFVQKAQATWVRLLAEYDDLKEVAAIAIDTDIALTSENVHDSTGWITMATMEFHVPTSSYGYVKSSQHIRTVMERAATAILDGRRVTWWDGDHDHEPYDSTIEKLQFKYLVKLVTPEPDWQQVIKARIESKGINNQAAISGAAFAERSELLLEYNGMRYASQSEIRIAQELEKRTVLFFPLAIAVRAETGNRYKDHREVDFLVCRDGLWGILEVSYHPDRFEKDSEKDSWFKDSGILCVQHYTAERCYNKSDEVVSKFLDILAKYRK
jgi:hypothetical protein